MDDSTKWCFVPTCLNSTKNTVNKWFVPIPVNPKRRELWFKAVNRNYCPNSERSNLYCCSDHFDLTEDAGDFFERDGEVVVKLKSSILPRISSSDALVPGPRLPSPANPHKKIKLKSTEKSTPQGVVSVNCNSSDDDEVTEINVVTSNPSDPRKALMNQRLAMTRQGKQTPNKAASTPVSKGPGKKTKQATPSSTGSSTHSVEASGQALFFVFENLRKIIPSVSHQQGLTKEQIINEAIEFIIQMRNKSDKRQGTMHYVMQSNAALSAKIDHLKSLVSLHERSELVLTKEIVDRRLGAVSAPKPASLANKKTKR